MVTEFWSRFRILLSCFTALQGAFCAVKIVWDASLTKETNEGEELECPVGGSGGEEGQPDLMIKKGDDTLKSLQSLL